MGRVEHPRPLRSRDRRKESRLWAVWRRSHQPKDETDESRNKRLVREYAGRSTACTVIQNRGLIWFRDAEFSPYSEQREIINGMSENARIGREAKPDYF